MIRYNSTLLHAALVRVYASTILLHLRSYDLFLLSPTATRRRALVLWVRFTWNEGRGGWEGKKFLFALTIILRLMTLTFSIFKFQAFSLHLLHNAVRGALIFYIHKLSKIILMLKRVSFLNVIFISPLLTITLSMIRFRVIFYC